MSDPVHPLVHDPIPGDGSGFRFYLSLPEGGHWLGVRRNPYSRQAVVLELGVSRLCCGQLHSLPLPCRHCGAGSVAADSIGRGSLQRCMELWVADLDPLVGALLTPTLVEAMVSLNAMLRDGEGKLPVRVAREWAPTVDLSLGGGHDG